MWHALVELLGAGAPKVLLQAFTQGGEPRHVDKPDRRVEVLLLRLLWRLRIFHRRIPQHDLCRRVAGEYAEILEDVRVRRGARHPFPPPRRGPRLKTRAGTRRRAEAEEGERSASSRTQALLCASFPKSRYGQLDGLGAGKARNQPVDTAAAEKMCGSMPRSVWEARSVGRPTCMRVCRAVFDFVPHFGLARKGRDWSSDRGFFIHINTGQRGRTELEECRERTTPCSC